MQVWVVRYDPESFTEELYQNGLPLVDPDSQARIKRFYRREDACRCLIGRLLPRMLLRERGITRSAMSFAVTQAGKPYITSLAVDPPIGYNVSHDNSYVAMAFAPGTYDPPSYQIGVDVMKIRLPPRETFLSFVKVFKDQLTAFETRSLLGIPEELGLRRFFWIWTMKEAFTKALGLGLSFDFRRLEYNVAEEAVTIDGQAAKGWYFTKFDVEDKEGQYVGVAAEHRGGSEGPIITQAGSDFVIQLDGVSFVRRAIIELY